MQDKTLRAVGYAAAHNKREIKRLYRRAFPAAERAPWRYFLRAGEAAQIVSYELDGAFVGFTISLPTPEFYYVFYLAIDEAARGRGCGSMILNEIVRTHGDLPVVLDMEAIDPAAPNAEQRVRRLRVRPEHVRRREETARAREEMVRVRETARAEETAGEAIRAVTEEAAREETARAREEIARARETARAAETAGEAIRTVTEEAARDVTAVTEQEETVREEETAGAVTRTAMEEAARDVTAEDAPWISRQRL